MAGSPFEGRKELGVRALVVGERINTRALENVTQLNAYPLIIEAGSAGAAALFRYGAVVLFGLKPLEEAAVLESLRPLITEPVEEPESDTATILLDPAREEGIESSGVIRLAAADVDRLAVVAEVLARSIVLVHYEESVEHVFDHIEPLAEEMRRAGRVGRSGREVIRKLGDALLVRSRMVGRLELVDKPELLWERPDLERLYARLIDEYEVHERHRALDLKLELLSETGLTVVNLNANKHSLRVEWYIVILILVEIVIMVYEMAK